MSRRFLSSPQRPPWGLLCFGLLAWAFGHGPVVGADDAKSPAFILHTADGKDVRGPLRQLDTNWSVRVAGDRAEAVASKKWIALRRADVPRPAFPSDTSLILANGDRLPVAAADLKLVGERLTFRHPALGHGKAITVPLSSTALLWLADPVDDADRLRRRLLTEKRPRDLVLLRNGDVLEGILTGLGATEVQLTVGKAKTTLALSRVAALALSSGTTSTPPKGTYARLVLADGSRLSLTAATCSDGKTLTGTTAFGAAVRVPLAQVRALDLMQASAIYLSDLKPRHYEHTPYLGVNWKLIADGSVTGRDLRLAGGTFDKGLGMHSASRVTYDLPSGVRRFEALVGLDDETGRKGSVRIAVLVDGKDQDLGLKGDLTHRTGLLAVSVPLTGAKQLTLVVDFGKKGDVGDHVNWADARLIK